MTVHRVLFHIFLAAALILVNGITCGRATDAPISFRAWQQEGDGGKLTFPELEDEIVQRKANVGIAFTGGGSRAMIAALGQLAALSELGLLKDIKYATGVSGGSWAVSLFSWYTPSNESARNDAELLGKLLPPDTLTLDSLRNMSNRCGRSVVTNIRPFTRRLSAKASSKDGPEHRGRIADLEVEVFWHQVFKDFGVPQHAWPAFDGVAVEEILSRNPELSESDFVTLSNATGHPFPIVPTTLLGPEEYGPYVAGDRSNEYIMVG